MASRRILFVDDEMVVRLLARQMFAASGDDAVIASSVPEALRYLADREFDIVITDVQMPKGGGAAVAERAFARGFPVLFVTGHSSGAEVSRFLAEGARLLRKPFSPEEFFDLLDEITAGETVASDVAGGADPAPADADP